ncbi:MAG: hypothetical protein HXX08_00650 [Chloroflexi bacterium]|uniref:Uncharacterized protein n=1 Tax=Candidatus Chlorohelix allophototropha TaxID=3003348 RepID=A0A8T7LQQ1_9CHLR|nr:hypothetical protein [Chloroflexota bacterium]WJW66257.1 hypothetical protein OZ401_002049 [Chloroflexota bacterium L227-S17]
MKCIYCNTDSRYKERTDGTCKKCHRPFAFEPTKLKDFVITDPGFKATADAVAEKRTMFYTARQLYYQLMKRKSKQIQRASCYNSLIGLLFIASIALLIFTKNKFLPATIVMPVALFLSFFLSRIFVPALGLFSILSALLFSGLFLATKDLIVSVVAGATLLIVGLALVIAVPSGKKNKQKLAGTPQINFQAFEQNYLGAWIRAHGIPEKMLPRGGRLRPELRQQPAPDLHLYSFDRLLVVDNAEIADMLLANNFHTETNTPVVSIDGYPQDVFRNVMEMVRRNPNLKVFALHDASVEGCLLPLRLREDPAWFPQPNIAVIDLGLRPRQLASLPNLPVQKGYRGEQLPPDMNRALSLSERRWLQGGYYAELGAFKPSQLIKIIYRQIQRAADLENQHKFAAVQDPHGFFQTTLPGAPAIGIAYTGQPGENPGGGFPPPTVRS